MEPQDDAGHRHGVLSKLRIDATVVSTPHAPSIQKGDHERVHKQGCAAADNGVSLCLCDFK